MYSHEKNIDVDSINFFLNKNKKQNIHENINSSNVFNNTFNTSNNTIKNIKKNDFFTNNDIYFSKLISTTLGNNYYLYFNCIEDVSPIVFNEYTIEKNDADEEDAEDADDEDADAENIQPYTIEEPHKKYISVIYTEKSHTIKFSKFFLSINNAKMFIYYLTDSYCHLLDALELLENKKVCFFNLNPENICFNSYYKPLLCNFEMTFDHHINRTSVNNINTFLGKITNFIYYPLEVHVMFYLFNSYIESGFNNYTLTFELVEIISNEFVKNLYILNNYPEKYREKFLKECITFLNQFINKKHEYILEKCISYSTTWDNYSLNIIYLFFYNGVVTFLKPNTKIYNKIISLLLKNISPNPLERLPILKTKHYIHALQDSVKDWSFVNKIQQNKIDELYNELF